MRTAAAAFGIYEFWALDIEKVWNKRLLFHFISLLFIWTYMCIIQSWGKYEQLHWERLSYICSSEVFTQRINPPHHKNWKDLKLDVETADTKILSREGERVWNKLPANGSKSEKSFLATSLWKRKFKLKTFLVYVILSRNCLCNLRRLRALLHCSQNWI